MPRRQRGSNCITIGPPREQFRGLSLRVTACRGTRRYKPHHKYPDRHAVSRVLLRIDLVEERVADPTGSSVPSKGPQPVRAAIPLDCGQVGEPLSRISLHRGEQSQRIHQKIGPVKIKALLAFTLMTVTTRAAEDPAA